MGRRVIHDTDFMNFVMTPPRQEAAKYEMYEPVVSTMRVISNGGQDTRLGDLPSVGNSGGQQDWVTPVVVIVVSAMALMTLYAVISDRKR